MSANRVIFSRDQTYTNIHMFNKLYQDQDLISQKIQKTAYLNPPVKSTQSLTNGAYLDYLIKNQNLMQGQYYQRLYANSLFQSPMETPVYNQYNTSTIIHDQVYPKAIQQVFNTNTPPTPTANNGTFFSTYINQTPQVYNHNINVNTTPVTTNPIPYQPVRVTNPTSLFLLNEENSALKQNLTNNCADNCLNRSFENTLTSYNHMNAYDISGQVFNQHQQQNQPQPQLHHYTNGVTHHQPQQQQIYYQTNRMNPLNGFILNQIDSPAQQTNMGFYQQQQQGYQLIN